MIRVSLSLVAISFFLFSNALAQGIIQSIPAAPETDWSKPAFWETMDGRPVEQSWEFQDGEIRLVKPRGGRGSLLSGPLPPHFQLSWRWKINAKTNSGLKYRVRQFSGRWLGLEYQIIDYSSSSSRQASTGGTAAIYDLVAPIADKPLNPPGQWNHSRVVAIGDRVEHYLNDTLVAKVSTRGPAWDAKIAISKFWGADRFGQPADGDRVMLTDHGGKIVFKDFEFQPREPPPETSPVASLPFLGNALRNSWADQNSIVIWTRTTARPEMVVDGPQFVSPDKSQVKELLKTNDEAKLLAAQLPPGAELNEMSGACPGAAGEVRLTYFPAMGRQQMKSTPWQTTSAEHDFTMQWKLDGLAAGKEYAAVIEARPPGGGEVTAVVRGAFKTAPDAAKSAKVKFCITTCHDYLRRDDGRSGHKIYPALSKLAPDFIVHAGDIEYYDKPEPWAWTRDLMRFKWARIFSLPSNRDFYSRTSSYFLKDDHDTLKNDCWAGQTYGAVTFAEGVKLFNEEQFPSHPTRYKTVSWGKDLQVWLLEGRDYRSPNDMPDGPQKTILGGEQKAWLLRTLRESKATFKLVFSPTPIVGPDRANKKDNHANAVFEHEGRELRDAFSQFGNVIVLCGDRHWQYASVDPDTRLWEFGCGPGSEKHQLGWKQGDQRPQHAFLRVAGGFLSGEVGKDKQGSPTLTVRHHEVTGKPVSKFEFPAAFED